MNIVLLVIAFLAIIIGLFVLVQLLRAKTYEGDAQFLEHKDGLPILPRNEREIAQVQDNICDTPACEDETADALSSLAMVASQTAATTTSSVSIADEYDAMMAAQSHEEPKQESLQKQVQLANTSANFASQIDDFDKNSPILDRHLSEQQTFDQNNDPLVNARDTISIVITPYDQYVGLPGKKILDLVRSYGLKYGVMNMYHRYEREDGTGDLWFSMLGVNHEGVKSFDLNTLADSHFTGLALFLPLPHPNASRGFDSMLSTARMIAKELGADIHDDEGYLVDEDYVDKLRLHVANYR